MARGSAPSWVCVVASDGEWRSFLDRSLLRGASVFLMTTPTRCSSLLVPSNDAQKQMGSSALDGKYFASLSGRREHSRLYSTELNTA